MFLIIYSFIYSFIFFRILSVNKKKGNNSAGQAPHVKLAIDFVSQIFPLHKKKKKKKIIKTLGRSIRIVRWFLLIPCHRSFRAPSHPGTFSQSERYKSNSARKARRVQPPCLTHNLKHSNRTKDWWWVRTKAKEQVLARLSMTRDISCKLHSAVAEIRLKPSRIPPSTPQSSAVGSKACGTITMGGGVWSSARSFCFSFPAGPHDEVLRTQKSTSPLRKKNVVNVKWLVRRVSKRWTEGRFQPWYNS